MSRSSSRDVNVPLLRADGRSLSRPGSRSRPRTSRHSTNNSVPSITYGPEDIINPNAQLNEEDVELIEELVFPHRHAAEATLVEEADETQGAEEEEGELVDDEWRQKLPWWKRPSPWWSVQSSVVGRTNANRLFLSPGSSHLCPLQL